MKSNIKTMRSIYLVVLLVLVLCFSFMFSACKPTTEDTAVYSVVFESDSIELEKGSSIDLVYSLTKDGVADETLTATVTVEGNAVTYDETTKKITAVASGEAIVKVKCTKGGDTKSLTVSVPEYSIGFTSTTLALEEGETKDVPYVVKKDGATINSKKVTITAEGDAIRVNDVKKEVTAVKPGNAKVIVKLVDYPEVQASLNVVVSAVFFSRDDELKRGEIDFTHEKNGKVDILGGQATVLCVQDDVKFVFKGTLNIPGGLENGKSVGIGAFLDNGNNALWFAVRGNEENKKDVYIRNFLKGWNDPAIDRAIVKNANLGETVEYILVRNGDDYYFSVGGINGYFRNSLDGLKTEPLFPGFYSQEKAVSLTNYSVAYDQETIDAEIAKLGPTVSNYGPINSFNSINESNEVTMKFMNAAWDAKHLPLKYSATIPETFSLDFDVKFSQAQNDAKLAVKLGTFEFHVNNKGNLEGQLFTGDWGQSPSNSANVPATEWAKVRIQRDGTKARFYINQVLIAEKDGVPNSDYIEFFTFANSNEDAQASVTFKNLSVTSVYLSEIIAPSPELEQNSSMQLSVNKYGSEDDVVWSVTKNLTAGDVTITADGKLETTFDATGSVEVSATLGNCVVKKTIQIVDVAKVINSYASNITYADDNSFVMQMVHSSWNFAGTKAQYKDTVPSDSFIMTFDLAMSSEMKDGKFCVQFGEEVNYNAFTICFGKLYNNDQFVKNQYKAEIKETWGGSYVDNWDVSNLKVKIIAKNGVAEMYINDYKANGTVELAAGEKIYFWEHNEEEATYNTTATVSNIAFRTEFLSISGQDYVQQGKTAQLAVTKYNSENSVVWSIDPAYEGVSIDQTGLLTAADTANVGEVTVKATIGDYSDTFKVNVMEMIRCVTSTNSNLVSANETGFVSTMSNSDWNLDGTKIKYKDAVPGNNFILAFDLAMSSQMSDSKFNVQFGEGNDWRAFTICFVGNSYKAEVRGGWGGYSVSDWDINNISVRIEVIDKVATMYINDNYICRKTINVEAGQNIYFWHHNTESATYNTTATVTNLELITNFAKVIGPDKAEKNKVTTYTANVYGETSAVTWSVETTLNSGTATISEDGKLTVSPDAEGSVIVKAQVGDKTYVKAVQITDPTNAIVTEKACYSDITNDGFKLQAVNNGWNLDGTKSTYKEVVPAENFEITFNLSLSNPMTDGKFCVQFGDEMFRKAFTICFAKEKVGEQYQSRCKTEIKDIWGGVTASDWDISNINVKIKVVGLVATMYINDTYVGHGSSDPLTVGENIYFWELNETAADEGTIMTVSNIKLTKI